MSKIYGTDSIAQLWFKTLLSRLLSGSTRPNNTGFDRVGENPNRLYPVGMVGVGTTPSVSARVSPPDLRVVACASCTRDHSSEDIIFLGGHAVCAGCKPRRLQCLREGAPTAGVRLARGVRPARQLLVVEQDAVVPSRCVHCNGPATWHAPRKYAWHPPWVILSLLLSPLAFIPFAAVFGRMARFDLHLCEEHRMRQHQRHALAWIWGLSGLLLMVCGILYVRDGVDPRPGACLIFSGFASMLTAPLFAQRNHRSLLVRNIDAQGTLHLNGAHPDYLASLL